MTEKYVCITQQDRLTTFNGPSGTTYVSTLGEGFVVSNSLDIEHFQKNKRFVKQGLFAKKVVIPDAQESFKTELDTLGLTKKSVESLLNLYENSDLLRSQVLAGNDLTGDINKTDAGKVVKHYIPEEDNLDQTKTDGDEE